MAIPTSACANAGASFNSVASHGHNSALRLEPASLPHFLIGKASATTSSNIQLFSQLHPP